MEQIQESETKRQRCQALLTQLESDRSTWEPGWRDVDDYILPDRCQWTETNHNQGNGRTNKIIDSTAEMSFRTLEAGMFTGMCSPARQWFAYSLPDKDLAAWGPAKQWLSQCSEIGRAAFRNSNWYQEVPLAFGNMAAFGVHAMIQEADSEELFRFYNQPIGAYYLASSDRNVIDTIVRKLYLTVRNIVKMFGIENCSRRVQALHARSGGREIAVEVVHAVYPNDDYLYGAIGPRGKRWLSHWYESGGDSTNDGLLRESGFDYFPALCPRWSVSGRNVYGFGPGRSVRGDAKALQAYERSTLRAVNLAADPPLQGPEGIDPGAVNLVPGGFTSYDRKLGSDAIKPLLPPGTFDINAVELKAEQARNRIRRATFEDLFLMLASSDRRQITAEEIRAKQEEKILALGPVWERANDELLDPAVRNAFMFMHRANRLPPPPPEIQGHPLTIEYVGTLGQIQKSLGLASIDRVIGFVGSMAQVDPTVVDKINRDAAIDRYAEALNTPWDVVHTQQETDAIRATRAQQQQAAQDAQNALTVAQGAKLLSETDTRSPSALTDLIQAQTGVAI